MLHLLVIVKLTGTFEQLSFSGSYHRHVTWTWNIYKKIYLISPTGKQMLSKESHFFVSFHFFDVWNQLLLFVDVKLYELKIKD